MRQEEKIRIHVLGEERFKQMKETKGNILMTKSEQNQINKLIEIAKHWDNFNLDLYLKRFQYD